MSIVPTTDFEPPFFGDHFLGFPFPTLLGGAWRNTRVEWSETPGAHVVRASLPGEDVLVGLTDDDREIQISTDGGGFSARFAVPADARLDQMRVSMAGGVLTVTIPKDQALGTTSNVRVVEITGDD